MSLEKHKAPVCQNELKGRREKREDKSHTNTTTEETVAQNYSQLGITI